MSWPDLVILAAGRGSRMKDLTGDLPKCLTTLAGESLLSWQIKAAQAAGFGIHLIGGYAREKLPAELVHFVNPRWSETNMVATLFQAADLLAAKPCLVAYSDIVYRPEHLSALWRTEGACAVLYDLAWESLWRLRNEDFLADAESFKLKDGRQLLTIGEKGVPLTEIEGQYMGLLKFTPTAWAQIDPIYKALPAERRDKIDMTSFLRLLLAEGLAIEAAPISGGWVEVDTAADRDIYEAALSRAKAEGQVWLHDWRFEK